MSLDPVVVEQAVLKAISDGGLSPEDCRELGADNAVEVSRRLIEIARAARSKATK